MSRRKSTTYSSNKISYKKDIIKEVYSRNKLGSYSEEQMADVLDCLFEYIAHQCQQDDIFAIEIPHLGYLHTKLDFIKAEKIKCNNGSEEYNKQLDRELQIKRFADEVKYATPHIRPIKSKKFQRDIKKEYEIDDNQRKMNTASLQILSAIEEKQNKDKSNL